MNSAEQLTMDDGGVVERVKRYYRDAGISPATFACTYRSQCARGPSFVEATEPYVGQGYENGDIPRLLFLSLDPGSSEADPEARTCEAHRRWEETACNEQTLRQYRLKHWFYTHELAARLLQGFLPNLSPYQAHTYFAHTNSAKCCMNKEGRRQADWVLFENCRGYIPGEIVALRPDILVTQGDAAKAAIDQSQFLKRVKGDLKRCGYAVLTVEGRSVLWFHTYHPRYGRFFSQRKECCDTWADVVSKFIKNPAQV